MMSYFSFMTTQLAAWHKNSCPKLLRLRGTCRSLCSVLQIPMDTEQTQVNAEQTQAAAIVSTCTSLNLRKAARAASQFLESYLAPLGLHTGQFGILSHISKAGSVTDDTPR